MLDPNPSVLRGTPSFADSVWTSDPLHTPLYGDLTSGVTPLGSIGPASTKAQMPSQTSRVQASIQMSDWGSTFGGSDPLRTTTKRPLFENVFKPKPEKIQEPTDPEVRILELSNLLPIKKAEESLRRLRTDMWKYFVAPEKEDDVVTAVQRFSLNR